MESSMPNREKAFSARILMTTDSLGGVWNYSLGLIEQFPRCRFFLAVMGRLLSQEQRRAAKNIPNLEVIESDYRLEWMPDSEADIERAGGWLLTLEKRLHPDLIHLN